MFAQDELRQIVLQHASPQAAEWFRAQLQAPAVQAAFAGAGRRLGNALVQTDAPLLQGRPLAELGRMALLLSAVDRGADAPALVQDLFWRGSADEKVAVLRALPLLPEPARFVAIGIEAVRASVGTVFEAVACENPFPADHFPEPAFNQLVLKAIFNEVSCRRIEGLARRAGPELTRMAQGYGSERRAAGRPVPEDVAYVSSLQGNQP